MFIRVYSSDTTYGYHFARNQELSLKEVTIINFKEFAYSENTYHTLAGEPTKQTEHLPFEFLDHMRGGGLAPVAEKPKLLQHISNGAKDWAHYDIFFQPVPHLMPEVALDKPHDLPRQPHLPPILQDNNDGLNLQKYLLPLLILCGIFIIVKVVQKAWNKRGTGAVA